MQGTSLENKHLSLTKRPCPFTVSLLLQVFISLSLSLSLCKQTKKAAMSNHQNEEKQVGVDEEEEEEEKWVKHYSSNHQILLVGEGDFSFSLSLANSFGSASNILASSLDPYGIFLSLSLSLSLPVSVYHFCSCCTYQCLCICSVFLCLWTYFFYVKKCQFFFTCSFNLRVCCPLFFFFCFLAVIFGWLGLFDTFLFTFQAANFLSRKVKEKWFWGYVMVLYLSV